MSVGLAEDDSKMPEGMVGWWHYIGGTGAKSGFAKSPGEACTLNARNHFQSPLYFMTPVSGGNPVYHCGYKHSWIDQVSAYSPTQLFCKAGYFPRWPGVCVKWAETPQPTSCSPSDPGNVVGNPVVVSSGAKVQAETDIPGLDRGALRVTRTYRTFRETGKGQSGGQGWSFSFDRDFFTDATGNRSPYRVGLSSGDGSYSEFVLRTTGEYKLNHGKRQTLQSVSDTFDEWIHTTEGGDIERYKKVDGKFLFLSTHFRGGGAQFYSYGADNKLVAIADSNGRSLSIAWDGDVVASITGAGGTVRYEYEPATVLDDKAVPGTSRLVAVNFYDDADKLGGSKKYHYEDEDFPYLLTGVTDENGARYATYAYNRSGQAVLSEHAGGVDRYKYSYPEQGKRFITDPLGTTRVFGLTYPKTNGPGRITGMSQPAGSGCGPGNSAMVYDADGNLSSSTDFNERKTCYTNDAARGLETSRVFGLSKNAACPKSSTDPIQPNTRRISTRWHPDWNLEAASAGPKLLATYVYNGQRDSTGNVVSCAENATLPNGKPIAVLCAKTLQGTSDTNGSRGFSATHEGPSRTWTFSYNASGQLLTSSGPKDTLGQMESITNVYFDESNSNHTKGDLATSLNAEGEKIHFLEYSKDGLATRLKRADGVLNTLVYGPRQRLASSTMESSAGYIQSTQYSYDAAGQVTAIVAPNGAAVAYSYDNAHRLIGLADPSGNRANFGMDTLGNIIHLTIHNSSGQLVREKNQGFDGLGRLQNARTSSHSTTSNFSYDRNGNLTVLKDEMGRISSNELDNFSRLRKEILPATAQGKPTTEIGYEYDDQDRLVSVIDPRKLITRYARDGFGQRTEVRSPDSGTTRYTFDDAGNVLTSTDSRGASVDYRYDGKRRATKVGDDIFVYGKNDSSAAGRLISITDESGSSDLSYDGFGRLTRKRQIVGTGTEARSFSLSYEYGTTGSSTGHIAAMIFPSGNRIEFSYGVDGQASAVAMLPANGTQLKPVIFGIQHEPFGPAKTWTWGNSSLALPNIYRREFDAVGRLKSYPLGHSGGTETRRTLTYDDAGRIVSMRHSGGPQVTNLDQSFVYDGLDRLSSVDGTGLSQGFDFDASGNRTMARFGSSTYMNAISVSSNRLNTTSGPEPARVNVFDKAGNLISDGKIQYHYGRSGRTASADAFGIRTEYRYSAFGQRVVKIGRGADRTYYVYDPQGRIIGEYDSIGNMIQETVFLDDLPIAVLKPGGLSGLNTAGAAAVELYYVFADHLGTPRVITESKNNSIVWRWDNVDPFGLQQPDERPGSAVPFQYNSRFPGQTFDKETNTNYNYFRSYDPQIGRYTQSDPIGLEAGINTYAYVGGNPITGFDPYGLDDWGRVGRGAIVYTHMSEGYTVMYDQESKILLSDIPTNNEIVESSLPGADLPYSGTITLNCQLGLLGVAYGRAKVLTGDSRSRWIHGGGTGLRSPYALQQGWKPTMGCTRAQNGDVISLCEAIAKFRRERPGVNISYRRD